MTFSLGWMIGSPIVSPYPPIGILSRHGSDILKQTLDVSELEPVQNFQTGPVRPVQLLDRSGPAGDRPV
jgi:hypothetical protein